MLLYYIICAVIGYLIGSIPFGYIIVKLVKGIDIRTVGSGNIGATNVARVLGWPAGIIVFLLDALKGIAAVIISFLLGVIIGKEAVFHSGYITEIPAKFMTFGGLAAILGHLFPIWFQFKGGKGVATGLGVFLILMPIPTFIAFGIWLVIVLLLRYVSVASILAVSSLPVTFYLFIEESYYENYLTLIITACTVMTLVIIKHIPNIKRLIAGTEPKVSFRKK